MKLLVVRRKAEKRKQAHLIDGVLLARIGHDHSVVLGSHVRLDSLSVGRSAVVDVLALHGRLFIFRYDLLRNTF